MTSLHCCTDEMEGLDRVHFPPLHVTLPILSYLSMNFASLAVLLFLKSTRSVLHHSRQLLVFSENNVPTVRLHVLQSTYHSSSGVLQAKE